MRKLKIGVLGAGGIARRKTIPGLLQARNCTLAAVMDVENVEPIAREFHVPRAYARAEDLLADPEIEAVYIASPVFAHGDQIRAAAEHGKHVLCEKPLTRTLREAKAAVAACRKHAVFLQEGYMMKFHGAHTRIRKILDEGRLGRLVYLRAQLSCWYPPIPGAWRQNPELGGGGALMDMATHLLDLLEHFAGPARRLAAFTGHLVQAYPSEDSATVLLEFANGAQATVDSFFCIPDQASQTRLEIYGSCGSVLAEGTIGQGSGGRMQGCFAVGTDGYEADQRKDGAGGFRPVEFPQVNPYTAECEYFADCVLGGRPPEINGAENALRVLRLAEAAYRSAREGQVVVLEGKDS